MTVFVIKCICGCWVNLDKDGNKREKYVCCDKCGYASNLNPNYEEK